MNIKIAFVAEFGYCDILNRVESIADSFGGTKLQQIRKGFDKIEADFEFGSDKQASEALDEISAYLGATQKQHTARLIKNNKTIDLGYRKPRLDNVSNLWD